MSPRPAAPSHQPFLAWPGGGHFRLAAVTGLGLAVFFYTCYGLASWLTSLHDFRIRIDFPFEQDIPLVPAFSIAYLSIVPLLLLAPFVLREPRRYLAFIRTIAAETVVGSAIFVVFPVKDNFAASRNASPLGDVYTTADLLNLEGNMLPSLHVAIAVTCALAFGRGQTPAARTFLWAWTALIIASTMLTHQHHLLDLPAGALLAVLTHRRLGVTPPDHPAQHPQAPRHAPTP